MQTKKQRLSKVQPMCGPKLAKLPRKQIEQNQMSHEFSGRSRGQSVQSLAGNWFSEQQQIQQK